MWIALSSAGVVARSHAAGEAVPGRVSEGAASGRMGGTGDEVGWATVTMASGSEGDRKLIRAMYGIRLHYCLVFVYLDMINLLAVKIEKIK